MLKKSPAVREFVSFVAAVRASRIPHTKPDDNKFNTESIGGLLAVVLDDLRRKDDHPAGN
jgi:hypothetical protein